MHVVCANIFGANVLESRFKIDVVIMIICSIVIIINSVLTLQVLTAKIPDDCGPCEIKVHPHLIHFIPEFAPGSIGCAYTYSGPFSKSRYLNNHSGDSPK